MGAGPAVKEGDIGAGDGWSGRDAHLHDQQRRKERPHAFDGACPWCGDYAMLPRDRPPTRCPPPRALSPRVGRQALWLLEGEARTELVPLVQLLSTARQRSGRDGGGGDVPCEYHTRHGAGDRGFGSAGRADMRTSSVTTPTLPAPACSAALRFRRRTRAMTILRGTSAACAIARLVHAQRGACAPGGGGWSLAGDTARWGAGAAGRTSFCPLPRALSVDATADEPSSRANPRKPRVWPKASPAPRASPATSDPPFLPSSPSSPPPPPSSPPSPPAVPTEPFSEWRTSRSQWAHQLPVHFHDIHMKRAAAKLDDFKASPALFTLAL